MPIPQPLYPYEGRSLKPLPIPPDVVYPNPYESASMTPRDIRIPIQRPLITPPDVVYPYGFDLASVPEYKPYFFNRPTPRPRPNKPLRPINRMSGSGRSDGRSARAAIVRRVMSEKGLKMIEASKYVKEHGLY